MERATINFSQMFFPSNTLRWVSRRQRKNENSQPRVLCHISLPNRSMTGFRLLSGKSNYGSVWYAFPLVRTLPPPSGPIHKPLFYARTDNPHHYWIQSNIEDHLKPQYIELDQRDNRKTPNSSRQGKHHQMANLSAPYWSLNALASGTISSRRPQNSMLDRQQARCLLREDLLHPFILTIPPRSVSSIVYGTAFFII